MSGRHWPGKVGALAVADVLRLPDVRRIEVGWGLSPTGTTVATVALLVYAYDAGGAALVAVNGVVRTVPAAVVVKHGNPCGVALAGSIEEAYELALAADPVSAFGCVLVLNRPIAGCAPNPAHEAIARWSASPGFTLVTQNVDGLHERAGTRNVVRYHGSIWRLRCTATATEYTEHTEDDHPAEWEDLRVPLEPLPPKCPSCGALARPGRGRGHIRPVDLSVPTRCFSKDAPAPRLRGWPPNGWVAPSKSGWASHQLRGQPLGGRARRISSLTTGRPGSAPSSRPSRTSLRRWSLQPSAGSPVLPRSGAL